MKLALVGGAAAALTLTLAGGASLLRGSGRANKQLAGRLAALSGPKPSRAPAASVSLATAAPDAGRAARWRRSLLGLLGYDTNVPSRPLPLWLAVLLSLGVARAVVWLEAALMGPLAWVDAPLIAFFVLRGYFRWTTVRWQTALFTQFPDALATVVRAVRVGVALPEAIRRVARESPVPTAAIFSRIADEMAIGTPLHQAMAGATGSTGLAEHRFFATALILQSRAGGGLAATLDGLADVIRKRVAVRARGNALAGEAKASAAILSVLPVFTLVALAVVNPTYAGTLFSEAKGHAVLAAACGTEIMGIMVMRAMIRRALS